MDEAKKKQWYMDAVSSSLILRGLYKEDAMEGVRKYRLKERLDNSLDFQMHYDVEDVADEIERDYIGARKKAMA